MREISYFAGATRVTRDDYQRFDAEIAKRHNER